MGFPPGEKAKPLTSPAESQARGRGRPRRRRVAGVPIPGWMENKERAERALRIYEMYVSGKTYREISAEIGISIPSVYADINRAKVEVRERMRDTLQDKLLEQIERRRALNRQAMASLDSLRDHNNQGRRADRARAEVDILRSIAENEKAIEELLGMRNRTGTPDADTVSPQGAVTLTIDLRGAAEPPRRTIDATAAAVLAQGVSTLAPPPADLDEVFDEPMDLD